MRMLVAIGTRPEAIKLFPVIEAARKRADVDVRVCLTSQHRELLKQIVPLFGLPVHHDLDVMRPGQTLAGVTARILEAFDGLLEVEKPDWVVVQGDTTTAFACALGAFQRRIRVAHVEAGLRTHDKQQPFPEEANRRLVSVLADRHFCPSTLAAENLRREGIDEATISVTGNTVIDALHWVRDRIELLPPLGELLPALHDEQRLVLVTMHRRESFGAPMRAACRAIIKLCERFAGRIAVALPVHPNPAVRATVESMLGDVRGVTLLPPLEYPSFVRLLERAHFVVTDSGGVQEEAPALGKPVLVLRETTERPEGIDAGVARLVGTDATRILEEATRLLEDESAWKSMSDVPCPYGDGHAAERILDSLTLESATLEGAAT